jgi:hypothetical protein
LAHRVKAMTPLFWAKMLTVSGVEAILLTHLIGVTVNRAEKNPAMPSASTPP